MSGSYCLGENPEKIGFCDSCGRELQRRPTEGRHLERKTCVSCGRTMDHAVYFTVCPHCGFNYRIEISQIESEEGLRIRSIMLPLLVSIAAVCVILLLLLLA
jgi:predicted RNA-binding Zn-ribbon protein involved in translation (DUF1610 family)